MTLLEGGDTCQYVRMLLQLELAYMQYSSCRHGFANWSRWSAII